MVTQLRNALFVLALCAAPASAAPTDCVGPSAQRALASLQQRFGTVDEGAGLDRSAVSVHRRFRSPPQRATSAGASRWLLTHHGAGITIDALRPNEQAEPDLRGAITVVACSYAIDGRLDAVPAGQVVRGFRQRQQATIAATEERGGVTVGGLAGFSATSEWRGPRLVTLVFVSAPDATRYILEVHPTSP
jgi:hypothetical protein